MFYFIPIFIMHFLTYVLIPQRGDIESLVARSLAPFDENLTVRDYKHHLHPEEIRVMAEKFKADPSDLDALAALMPKWSGHPGGVDDDGLFAWKNHNPDGRYDWYVIGGRFDGVIRGQPTGHDPYDDDRAYANVVSARTLAHAPDLKERLPETLVAAGCMWLEWSTLIVDGWAKFHTETKDDNEWLREVKAELEGCPEHRVVGVDLHG